jgi:hypothetical protein
MRTMKDIDINIERFPRRANVSRWCRILGLSRTMFLRYISTNEIKNAYRHLNGRDLMVNREDVINWLQTKPAFKGHGQSFI